MTRSLPILFRIITCSAGVGLFAGSLGFLFAESLDAAVRMHRSFPLLLWLLPIVSWGLLSFQKRWGASTQRGQALLLEELESSEARTPKRLIPTLWGSALLSQLVGASVGREGGAVQLGGAVGSLGARIFGTSTPEQRARWIIAGMSGGFAGCFGTPFAAALFALEVRSTTQIERSLALDAILGSALGFLARLGIQNVFGLVTAQTSWPAAPWTRELLLSPRALLASVSLILLLALVGRVTLRGWTFLKRHAPQTLWLRALTLSACFLLLEKTFDPSGRLQGLGIETLQGFFQNPPSGLDVPGKVFATGVSLSLGFKGGEFIPLAFIGAGTGSALASNFALPLGPFAAAGFIALFGGLAQTPLSMIVLALELFVPVSSGGTLLAFLLPSLLAFGAITWGTFLLSPERGIYDGQKSPVRTRKGRLALRPWEYFNRS